MTVESKLGLLRARLNRLNTRAISKDNAGVRRKLLRQIRALEQELEREEN